MQNTNELPRTPSSEPPVPPQRSSRGGLSTLAIIMLVVAFILVLGARLLAGWEFGRNNSTSSTPGTTKPATTSQDAAVSRPLRSSSRQLVQINVTTEKGSGLGSGTIIDSRGYIVTNYHVVEGAKSIMVDLYDSTQLPGKLTGVDPFDDLAVVQITPPQHMDVAKIGDSSTLQVAKPSSPSAIHWASPKP